MKARDLAEARNNADNLMYVTEKSLRDLGDKVPVNDRGQIEQIIEELRSARGTEDLSQIRTLTDRLQQASHALTQQAYQQSGPGDDGMGGMDGMDGMGAGMGGDDGQSGSSGQSGSDEDVVEGEYRSV